MTVTAVEAASPQSHAGPGDAVGGAGRGRTGKRDVKAEALSSPAVQAMLDVFPAEIRDVEEM